MDWRGILATLSAEQLARLAESAGIQRASTAHKTLVKALGEHLDDALKTEALSLLGIERLRELARAVRPGTAATRKPDLINVLLASEREEDALALSELDFLLPDRGRRDLPLEPEPDSAVEVLPARPTGRVESADAIVALEVQHLLRRPHLRRAVFVVPRSDATLLERLLSFDLDDLIESAVGYVELGRDERAVLTFILDGARHGLGETRSGAALVALARELRGVVEIRLTKRVQPLRAQLLAFEEERPHGAHLTAIVGGGALAGLDAATAAASVECNLRVSGPIAATHLGCSLVKDWLAHLIRDARSLTDAQLSELGADASVRRKVAYKRELDTAHELALKHLAEQVCRRGRLSAPLFDPTVVEPPPHHQRVPLALAARPFTRGVLLLDAPGLGKTVEAALILSRELRRRRVLAASDVLERRRALVVAPTSLHGHWHEELRSKVGLEVQRFDPLDPPERVAHAQVLLCGPVELRRSWEELVGVDVLVVDEAMLLGEQTLEVLAKLRATVELCVVMSGAPAFDEPADVLSLAALACPGEGFGELVELMDEPAVSEQVAEELRSVCARTRVGDLPPNVRPPSRTVTDREYELDEAEREACAELRRMRADYLRRGDHEHGGAFIALESAFGSSYQAFAAVAHALLDTASPGDAALFGATPDPSSSFFRRSGYFKRRLRAVERRLCARLGPSAPLSEKEAKLLGILADCRREAVVIMTRYRATQARIATVLARAKITGEVEIIDEASTARERMGVVARFRERVSDATVADGPSGVLVCTDDSAVELGLHKAAHVLINYDLPWNPQAVERRILRLGGWGQREPVVVYNLVAIHPDRPMWTMDGRIAYACRELFSMAVGEASPALFEVEPAVLTARLTEEQAPELSLIEEPDEGAIAEADAWLVGDRGPAIDALIERTETDDRRLRERLSELWARVSHRQSAQAGIPRHLFGRLRQALLQGMVGVLCAPDRSVNDCEDWHLVVGLRLLVESAAVEAGVEPWAEAPEDGWLVEDESVHLWAVSPDGELMDWAEFLLGDGLVEVPTRDAERIVEREVLDFLVAEKRSLEQRELDAVPLSAWLESAPPALRDKLTVVAEHALAMAEARHGEVEASWASEKDARLVRLDARRHLVAEQPVARAATEAALARAHAEDVTIRHEVLGTQLFIVTH